MKDRSRVYFKYVFKCSFRVAKHSNRLRFFTYLRLSILETIQRMNSAVKLQSVIIKLRINTQLGVRVILISRRLHSNPFAFAKQ